jgi:5-methylcytosine-specific restriction endonuclease McrA
VSWSNHHRAHDWNVPPQIKHFCWVRDNGECQLRYPGICTGDAEELDHIIGIAQAGGRYDDPENLRWLCRACHKVVTQLQRWPKYGRQPERHPGIRRNG